MGLVEMTNTETMPRLRQYLRERGWDERLVAQVDLFSTPKLLVAIAMNECQICDRTRVGRYRTLKELARFTDEQAVIDWLEENYPK